MWIQGTEVCPTRTFLPPLELFLKSFYFEDSSLDCFWGICQATAFSNKIFRTPFPFLFGFFFGGSGVGGKSCIRNTCRKLLQGAFCLRKARYCWEQITASLQIAAGSEARSLLLVSSHLCALPSFPSFSVHLPHPFSCCEQCEQLDSDVWFYFIAFPCRFWGTSGILEAGNNFFTPINESLGRASISLQRDLLQAETEERFALNVGGKWPFSYWDSKLHPKYTSKVAAVWRVKRDNVPSWYVRLTQSLPQN